MRPRAGRSEQKPWLEPASCVAAAPTNASRLPRRCCTRSPAQLVLETDGTGTRPDSSLDVTPRSHSFPHCLSTKWEACPALAVLAVARRLLLRAARAPPGSPAPAHLRPPLPAPAPAGRTSPGRRTTCTRRSCRQGCRAGGGPASLARTASGRCTGRRSRACCSPCGCRRCRRARRPRRERPAQGAAAAMDTAAARGGRPLARRAPSSAAAAAGQARQGRGHERRGDDRHAAPRCCLSWWPAGVASDTSVGVGSGVRDRRFRLGAWRLRTGRRRRSRRPRLARLAHQYYRCAQ
jgi:hypothetical protein